MKTEDCKLRYPDSGRGSEFLARSINGAARCLCITFLLNLVCIVFAAPFGYAQAPVAVALASIALGIAFSRRLVAKRSGFGGAYFFAALHLAVVMLWIHFILGYFGLAMNVRFNAIVQGSDRVVIRDGGGGCCCSIDEDPVLYEITNKTEIAKFNEMFRFSERQTQCRCCGFPGVDWWRDGKRIAVMAMHHGKALRVEHERLDWRFADGSRRLIGEWLKDHGINSTEGGPLHLRCRNGRVVLATVAQQWAASHNGALPTMEKVREEAGKLIRSVQSCPSGGEYSLTVGEDGLVDVSCSAPGHK